MLSRFTVYQIQSLNNHQSRLSAEEKADMHNIFDAASATFEIMKEGNVPFSFFIDFFGDIVANHGMMLEMTKEVEDPKYLSKYKMEKLCKLNFMTGLEIKRLANQFQDTGLSFCCMGMLEYIKFTAYKLDAFNHITYRTRGLTSISRERFTASIWNKVSMYETKIKNNWFKYIKYVVSTTSEYLNGFEKARLEKGFYKRFHDAYQRLTDLMQNLRLKYLPDGVTFALDALPDLREGQSLSEKKRTVIHHLENLQASINRDIGNDGVMLDRAVMEDFVTRLITRKYRKDDDCQKLLWELVERIKSTGGVAPTEDSKEVKALKQVILGDFRNLMKPLHEFGGPFYSMIELILLILAKTMDFLVCLNHFTEKFIATQQRSGQNIKNRREQVEYNKQFDQFVQEIKNVLSSLEIFVFGKVFYMQLALKDMKDVHYGEAHNAVIDLFRLRIHMLDCVSTTNGRVYRSTEYKGHSEETSDDLWLTKKNEARRYLGSAFRYDGPTPLEDLPPDTRAFVDKQAQFFLDGTYSRAMEAFLTLCNSVGSLKKELQGKIVEIMTYTLPEVENDAAVAAVAEAVVAHAADIAAAIVDMADAAVDEAEVDMADVADVVSATRVDMADSIAAASVDMADAVADADNAMRS